MKLFAFLNIESGTEIIVVANYSALLLLPPQTNVFYWCSNSQGTIWLPGSAGGTYYSSGLYYCASSIGPILQYLEVPYQATQIEVDAGIITDKFVTPNTLENASKWLTKQNTITTGSISEYLRGDLSLATFPTIPSIAGLLVASLNLSDLTNVATARVNLELDKNTTFGDANYTVLASDKTISTSVTFTAPRTVTLIDGLNVGKELIISDSFQAINGVNTLTIAVPSGKKLNGVLNGTVVINAPGGWRRVKVDALGDFSFDAGISRISTSATGAVINFSSTQVFNTVAAPSSANITDDLTDSRIGIVQKIYHNSGTEPTFPVDWVRLGSGNYTVSVLNIIYCEWVSGTRVEYWIVKG